MIRVVHPGSGIDFLPIPDPGVKKAPYPESATLDKIAPNKKLKHNPGRGR
jgi:hypothetical protein